ncbi:endo-1,4-beta-xylanase [Pedobacter duraquae]|uniref:Beta-xylanase n=1 Tax=Pedobacter duraquae TaxID=425511 RepID=A0A4R6IQX1_9SPHI|nr:endo-1,4-beta-xylanase [Pedobacter duraquae]TDO24601.1 endo-1,4-beta-xylanase [Pedobacter duraquae]
MNTKRSLLYLLLSILTTGTYLLSGYTSGIAEDKGLKDYYKSYFPIGVAVKPSDLQGAEKALIIKQFASITAENAMKMGPIHPAEDRYFWNVADTIVKFGLDNHIKVRGHCLVWHTQTPRWLFKDQEGQTVSKTVLLDRIKSHINTVVSRYRGKIYAWDVVNEVIADDTSFYRKSPLYTITGEDFIEQAFRAAHKADPKAVLFYNDYNTENPAKREKIYQMLKKLLAKGVPIHGVGLQAHWSINNPSKDELEKSITMFSSLGLQIQFTELDISVYTGRQGGQMITGEKALSAAEFTPEMERLQLEQYKMIFDVFRKYKKQITGVTFWNLSDKYSWLDGRGRKNFPLLFDAKLEPKKAYYEVVKF